MGAGGGISARAGVGGARLVQVEIETSRLQARYLSELTRDVGFSVEPGPSHTIRFPPADKGPYDSRLGYALLPSIPAAVARTRV